MTSNSSEQEPEAYFGDRRVAADEKASLVGRVFSSVAGRYDLMNDLMSGGLHRLWKDSLIDSLAPRPGMTLLDVAGGTGDIALRFLDAVNGDGRVTLVDINPDMLAAGEGRAGRHDDSAHIRRICGDAESLPLPAGGYDAYSIAFGLRNVTDMDAALRDAYRVLRHGGRFLCLEFCPTPALPLLDRVYRMYSDRVIPQLGQWVAGDAESYRYLVESIRRFPAPDAFAARISAAGFSRVRHRLLTGGICAIHSGWKV